MSADNFPRCLALVLKSEGGFVDSPHDPGGATNFGVTQAVYNSYRQRKDMSVQSVRLISQAEVADIYRSQYWDPIHGDDLPVAVDYVTFDGAVNSGVVQGAKWLQRALPTAPVDGQIGLGTLGAVKACTDYKALVGRMCAQRLSFLESLRNWAYFGKGWRNRVQAVQANALSMIA